MWAERATTATTATAISMVRAAMIMENGTLMDNGATERRFQARTDTPMALCTQEATTAMRTIMAMDAA